VKGILRSQRTLASVACTVRNGPAIADQVVAGQAASPPQAPPPPPGGGGGGGGGGEGPAAVTTARRRQLALRYRHLETEARAGKGHRTGLSNTSLQIMPARVAMNQLWPLYVYRSICIVVVRLFMLLLYWSRLAWRRKDLVPLWCV